MSKCLGTFAKDVVPKIETFEDMSGAGAGVTLTDHAHVVGLVDEVLQAVEHASAGSRHSAVDTSLFNKYIY